MSELPFKKNDLYVYDLAEPILKSLHLLGFDSNLNEVDIDTKSLLDYTQINHPKEKRLGENELLQLRNKSISSKLHCTVCNLDFKSQMEVRQHYQSDLHKCNIKRNIKGLSPVTSLPNETEEESDENNGSLDNINEDEEDVFGSSDSGSESESDLKEIVTQLEQQLSVSQDDIANNLFLNTQSPQIYFESASLPQTKNVFGIYKALFNGKELINPQLAVTNWNKINDQSSSISALFMVGGGHFAGAIVSHQRRNVKGNAKKQNESSQEQAIIMLESKTFHRYTTRRKQGGSQSAMDNAKGKANSAGSTLRRYNEAALKQDIQGLLVKWKPYLDKCENIYIRARSVYDKRIFFEHENNNNIIDKHDTRLKTFPFTTGRPNVSELKKSWCELTYLKITEKPKPIPVAKPKTTSVERNKSVEPQEVIKPLSPEEKYSDELVQLVKKARAPLLASYLRKNKLGINFRLQPESNYASTPTLLHYASQQGIKQMVIILLSNMKADPTIENNAGKTAWELTKTLPIKQAFQIARFNLGEDFTDWSKSHIGEPLSREQVDEINKKTEELEKRETEDMMKKESAAAMARQKAEMTTPKTGKGNVLSGTPSGVSLEQNLNSLTDEQRRRLMREQRARAAEARLARSS
ncbi:tRNA endonuclease Vms1p [Monosporozyma unispora]